MYGRLAVSSSCSALRIWPPWPLRTGLYERISILSGYPAYGVLLNETSLGMSTTTGPGRPLRAMWKAFFITAPRSRTSLTRKLCLTIGRVMPTVSHSWKASRPIAAVGTWPVTITIGMLSMYAVAMPVMALVTPGPEVTSATPTSPVARA